MFDICRKSFIFSIKMLTLFGSCPEEWHPIIYLYIFFLFVFCTVCCVLMHDCCDVQCLWQSSYSVSPASVTSVHSSPAALGASSIQDTPLPPTPTQQDGFLSTDTLLPPAPPVPTGNPAALPRQHSCPPALHPSAHACPYANCDDHNDRITPAPNVYHQYHRPTTPLSCRKAITPQPSRKAPAIKQDPKLPQKISRSKSPFHLFKLPSFGKGKKKSSSPGPGSSGFSASGMSPARTRSSHSSPG